METDRERKRTDEIMRLNAELADSNQGVREIVKLNARLLDENLALRKDLENIERKSQGIIRFASRRRMLYRLRNINGIAKRMKKKPVKK